MRQPQVGDAFLVPPGAHTDHHFWSWLQSFTDGTDLHSLSYFIPDTYTYVHERLEYLWVLNQRGLNGYDRSYQVPTITWSELQAAYNAAFEPEDYTFPSGKTLKISGPLAIKLKKELA